jgi:hypothetical protein
MNSISYIYIYIYIYIYTQLQDRLAVNDNERYLEYFEILNGYRSGEKAMMEMIEEVLPPRHWPPMIHSLI